MAATPAGRLVLARAGQVLAEAQKLEDALRTLAGHQRITLRLSASTVATSTFLPTALGPFLADYPEVDLHLVERKSSEVLQSVQAGESDLGVYDGNLPTGGLLSLPFRDDRLVLLVPDDHPLARHPVTRLRDALGYAFVCLPAERAMQRFIEEAATRNALPLQVRVRAPSFEAIAQLVGQRAGIAMLPETAARHALDLPVRIVTLEDRWATRELRLCIRDREGLSSHARALVEHLASEDGSRP